MRKQFIIDGNHFNDLEGFYTEIDKLLTKDLSWNTGHNLDAFNDLLRGGFGVHEYGEPILLKWINFKKSKEDFGYEATTEYYNAMLKTCHPDNIKAVEKKLENAERHVGPTLMDTIVETIVNTNNSGHDCLLETVD